MKKIQLVCHKRAKITSWSIIWLKSFFHLWVLSFFLSVLTESKICSKLLHFYFGRDQQQVLRINKRGGVEGIGFRAGPKPCIFPPLSVSNLISFILFSIKWGRKYAWLFFICFSMFNSNKWNAFLSLKEVFYNYLEIPLNCRVYKSSVCLHVTEICLLMTHTLSRIWQSRKINLECILLTTEWIVIAFIGPTIDLCKFNTILLKKMPEEAHSSARVFHYYYLNSKF